MALTPDDVVTKQFQHVRFKEGFDPEEVDDFLDEIVVEWRKALAENEELKAKIASLESGEQGSTEASAPAPAAEPEPAAETTPATSTPSEASATAASSAGIIELAQRVHDEHVAEGIATRDKLISEAEDKAARIVSEAEAKQREAAARAEKERATLQGKIDELREFETTYRSQLRGYIEGQLHDLDASGDSSVVAGS